MAELKNIDTSDNIQQNNQLFEKKKIFQNNSDSSSLPNTKKDDVLENNIINTEIESETTPKERLQFIPSMSRALSIEGKNIYDRDIFLNNNLGKQVFDGVHLWILYKKGYRQDYLNSTYTSVAKIDPSTLQVIATLENLNDDISDMEYIDDHLWLICKKSGQIIKINTIENTVSEELILDYSRHVFNQGRCSSVASTTLLDDKTIIAWRDTDNANIGKYTLVNKFGHPISGKDNLIFSENPSNEIAVHNLSDGGFIIAWRDINTGSGIFTIFDNNGVPKKEISNKIFYKNLTNSITITSTDNDGFAIAWIDSNNDGKGLFTVFDKHGKSPKEKAKIVFNEKYSKDIESASLSNGNFILAWCHESISSKGSFSLFDSKGNYITKNKIIDFYENSIASFSVSTITKDNFVIAWKDNERNSRGTFSIFNKHGNPIENKIQIPFCNHDIDSVTTASLPNGCFIIIWNNWGYGKISVFDNDGNPLPDKNNLIFHEQSVNEISVTTLSNGNFSIAWSDWYLSPKGRYAYFDINAHMIISLKQKPDRIDNWPLISEVGTDQFKNISSITHDGLFIYISCPYGIYKINPQTFETDLLFGTKYNIFNRGSNCIACANLSSGNFIIAWADTNDSWKGKFSIFDRTGNNLLGKDSKVFHNFGIHHTSISVLTDGSFIIAWRGNESKGMFSHFDQEGNILPDQEEITFFNKSHLNGIATTALNDNSFVIAWTEGYQTQYGKFIIYNFHGNNLNTKDAEIFHTNGINLGGITTLGNNNFVISWSDLGDSRKGKFTIYTSDGTAVPDKISIIFNESDTRNIALSSLPNGNFVLGWSDSGDKGKGKFSLYGLDGESILGRDEIIFDTAHSSDIKISPLSNSGFLICWSSGDNGDFGMYSFYNHDAFCKMGSTKCMFSEGPSFDFMATTLTDDTIVIAWCLNDGENTGKFSLLSPHTFVNNRLMANDSEIYNFKMSSNMFQKIEPYSSTIKEIDLGYSVIPLQITVHKKYILLPIEGSNEILLYNIDEESIKLKQIGEGLGKTFIDNTVINGESATVISKQDDDAIYIINNNDLIKNEAIKIDIGRNPGFIKVIEDTIFVSHQTDSVVSKVSISSKNIFYSEILMNGAKPVHAKYDGQSIWVACKNPNCVTKINPHTNEIIGKTELDDPPVYCQYDGENVWVLTERIFGDKYIPEGLYSLIKINRETIKQEFIINLGYIMGSNDEIPSMECIGNYIYIHKNIRFKYINRLNTKTDMLECLPVRENIDMRQSIFDGKYIWSTRITDVFKLDIHGDIIHHFEGESNDRYLDIAFDGRYVYALKNNEDKGTQIEKYDIFINTIVHTSDIIMSNPIYLYFFGRDLWTLSPKKGGIITRYRYCDLNKSETINCEAEGAVNGLVFDGTLIWGLFEKEQLLRRIKVM